MLTRLSVLTRRFYLCFGESLSFVRYALVGKIETMEQLLRFREGSGDMCIGFFS